MRIHLPVEVVCFKITFPLSLPSLYSFLSFLFYFFMIYLDVNALQSEKLQLVWLTSEGWNGNVGLDVREAVEGSQLSSSSDMETGSSWLVGLYIIVTSLCSQLIVVLLEENNPKISKHCYLFHIPISLNCCYLPELYMWVNSSFNFNENCIHSAFCLQRKLSFI